MREIKILDLPTKEITDQDYSLIVSPDGKHHKGLFSDIEESVRAKVLVSLPDVVFNDTYSK